jgi:hypothetical protein
VLFKQVNAEPVTGTVLVALPRGSSGNAAGAHASQSLKGLKFVPLNEARQVPVGSFFDTTGGRVEVVTASRKGSATQSAEFFEGIFQTVQKRSGRGLTDARLAGGKFSSCRTGKKATAARRRLSKKTIRKLRANVNGNFRTSGKTASATARGTEWGMFDRCDGTLTRVRRGTVVVRDLKRRRNITVRAGKNVLVPVR